MFLQPKFLFYVWKSGNRPDANNNTKDNAMIGLIGCSVIVLQSQRSPHRTYILGKTLGCLHEIEATTPGKRIQMQKWTARFAACGNNKGFSCATAGQRFIGYWIFFIISCQKCGKTEDCKEKGLCENPAHVCPTAPAHWDTGHCATPVIGL